MNEWIEPAELLDFPGFYRIPGNAFVAINRDGVVVTLKHHHILTPKIQNHGYWVVRCQVDKKRKSFTVHRLLGLTFIPVPENLKLIPRKKLQINHKDGVKTNYALSNLEWCTSKQNLQHGHDIGLHKTHYGVLARHVLTNEIRKFVNLVSCARYFGLHPAKLFKHLRTPIAGQITSNWHVFKYNDGKPWPVLGPFDIVESKWEFAGIAICYNVELKLKVCHNSIKEACEVLGLDKTKLGFHRSKFGEDVPYNGWVFKTYEHSVGLDTSSIKSGTRYKGRKKRMMA